VTPSTSRGHQAGTRGGAAVRSVRLDLLVGHVANPDGRHPTAEVGGYFRLVVEAQAAVGLQLFFEHDPTIVLLDVTMPHMSGLHVLREIRRVSGVPVIYALRARRRGGPGAGPVAAQLTGSHVRVETAVRAGVLTDTLVEEACVQHAELIILGSRVARPGDTLSGAQKRGGR